MYTIAHGTHASAHAATNIVPVSGIFFLLPFIFDWTNHPKQPKTKPMSKRVREKVRNVSDEIIRTKRPIHTCKTRQWINVQSGRPMLSVFGAIDGYIVRTAPTVGSHSVHLFTISRKHTVIISRLHTFHFHFLFLFSLNSIHYFYRRKPFSTQSVC